MTADHQRTTLFQRKHVLLIVGLLFIASFIYNQRSQVPDLPDDRNRIVFMVDVAFEDSLVFRSVIDAFNDEYQDIFLDYYTVPYGTLVRQVVLMYAAGESPDIFLLPEDALEMFIERNALLQLNDDPQQPLFAVKHPLLTRFLCISAYTEHPEAAKFGLEYLLEQTTP